MNRTNIVKIQTENEDSGTAYRIGPGVYLTCLHVTTTANQINGTLENGDSISLGVLSVNESLDIVVLTESGSNPELSLSTIFIDKGDSLNFEGCPGGNYKSFTGKLNTDDPNEFLIESIEPSIQDYRGLSGGPVFSQGHLVGIAYFQNNRDIKFRKLSLLSNFLGKVGIKVRFEVPFRQITEKAILDLDERYTSKLPPLKLRNHKIFNGLALDPIYLKRFQKCCKDLFRWRTDVGKPFEEYNTEIEKHEELIRSKIREIFDTKSRMRFEDGKLLELLYAFDEYLDGVRRVIMDQGYDEGRRKKEAGEYADYPHPFHHQESAIQSIGKSIRKVINFLTSTQSYLATDPILILEGEAGQGKSHLLADIAKDRMARGEATLLWLGQQFQVLNDPRIQLLQKAGWAGSWEDFLNYLSKIAEFQGSRVLLFIDAVNEGEGLKLWPLHFPSLIADIRNYPTLGLVLSVRTTYKDSLFPLDFLEKLSLTTFKHEGFKGHEFKALTHFCRAFDLEVPPNGIFNPEFSNPQFLLLTCLTLREKGVSKFPADPQGFSELYKSYLEGKDKKWKNKLGLTINRMSISKAALLLSKQMLVLNLETISIDDACSSLNPLNENCQGLIDFMVAEDVLALDYFYNPKTSTGEYGVRFTYQKLSDYQKAEALLQEFNVRDAWVEGLKPEGILYKRFELGDDHNPGMRNWGLIEVLSILLPERFQIEFIELIEFPNRKDRSDVQWRLINFLKYRFVESLKWREPKSINRKRTKEIIGRFFLFNQREFNYWIAFLLEVSAIPGHPYNADHLHRLLSGYEFAERDAIWSEFIWDYYGFHDNGSPQPVKWLIDWSWDEDRHSILNDEVVRLSCIPLVWFLASSVRVIRDSATKGLVCLLIERPVVALKLMGQFQDCNDPYVVERLLGSVFGAITKTRTSKASEIQEICEFVFDWQFVKGNPGPNIMIRHYAKSILDFGQAIGIKIERNLELALSPYKSEIPIFPSSEECDAFKMDHDLPDFKEKKGFVHNKIHHSVMEWDFNRYEIDPTIGHFSPVSFTLEDLICELKSEVGVEIAGLFDQLREASLFEYQANRDLKRNRKPEKKIELENILKDFEKVIKGFKCLIEESLPIDKALDFQRKVVPYLENLSDDSYRSRNQLDHTEWARWILKRVFDLGWSGTLLGDFEEKLSNSYRAEQLPGKVERVGKKYQWIALYEALGIIADNHYLRYNPKSEEGEKYKGLWQVMQPDIDITALLADPGSIPKDEEEVNESIRPWWFQNLPEPEFEEDKKSWVKDPLTLPDFQKAIQVNDESDIEWLFLRSWFTEDSREEELFEDGRNSNRCSVKIDLDSFFLPISLIASLQTTNKKELQKTVYFPDEREKTGILNREWYWSPTYKYRTSEEYVGYDMEAEKKFNAIPSTHFQWFESDLLAKTKYLIPNTYLFENMNLRYRKEEGQFENSEGQLVCQDPSLYHDGDPAFLFRKDELLKFLKSNDLAMVVIVDGEKRYEESTKKGPYYHQYEFSQVISVFPDGQIVAGPLSFQDRNRPEKRKPARKIKPEDYE